MRMVARMALPLLAAAAAATATAAIPAAAQTERDLDLVWSAPAGCPTPADLRAEVTRVLGGPSSRHAVARAEVAHLGAARWSVHLATEVDGQTGERTIEADSCAALASATALIVAWTIDPARAAAASPAPSPSPPAPSDPPTATTPPEPPASAPPPAPAPPPPVATAPARAADPLARVAGRVALAALGDLGSLPGPAPGGELAVGATLAALRVEVSGVALASQDARRSAAEGAHLRRLELGLRGCFSVAQSAALELAPCLGARLTHLSSEGFGETTPYDREAWGSALEAAALGTWRLAGPVSLRAMLGLVLPLARPPVVVLDARDGTVPIAQASVASGRASLGLEVRFP